MATYQSEFPDFPASDMPVMPEGFADSSWHNDSCPSFTNSALQLIIFVDYLDPTQREIGTDSDRFIVQALDSEGSLTGEFPLVATENWNEVSAFVAVLAAFDTMTAEGLNDWYERTVGYRPQVDCPAMTDDDLRGLCRSYVRHARG